jgi:soluble lytic murein transglycosylase-like protein
MTSIRRAIFASTLALALASGVNSALAETPYEGMSGATSGSGRMAMAAPTALTPADRLSYTTAFDALRRGDLEAARLSARQAKDRVLLGQVEFERLFHPDHVATYDELSAWLDDYADLPCADRVYDLALRRRPDGAAEPKKPNLLGRTWDSVVAAVAGGPGVDPARAARVAYNADDLGGAVAIGEQIGDWWTVGLAQYRLGKFGDSFTAFARVANDPTEDPWVRAGAAYWTARAAGQSGRQDRIVEHLRLAAQWPATFYGQIALAQLGEEPAIENLGPRPYVQEARLQRAAYIVDPGVDAGELEAFVQNNPRARRTVALYEVGRRGEAESELRHGVRTAPGEAARMWNALARIMAPGPSAHAEAARIDATRYPMPVLEPEGGFTIEKALVYALARKETDFNPNARSGAGAYGMMQVMPGTAAEMTGDRSFVSDPSKLFQPAVNMRLGQTYVNRMLQLPAFHGDLLRAVASYNAGPGPMLGAIRKLGGDADPLLLIETIDVPQARDYVEKVVASYWIYQRLFGGPLKTLEAVAAGAPLIPISLDYTAPASAPVQIAQSPVIATVQ